MSQPTTRMTEANLDSDGLPEIEPYDRPVPARSFEKASIKDLVYSAGLWTAGLGWLAPALGTMTVAYQFVPSWKINWTGRLYCKVQIAVSGSTWSAEVHPDVDEKRPYIFVQNHTNHLDHVMLYNATPHFKQGLELESHFDFPFYGRFMRARGTIPVKKGADRGQTTDLRDRVARELAEGRSILAFPEGTRTTTGRVEAFRKGIFYIARDLGVPVVPAAVTGSFNVLRKGSLVMRPGNHITVYCEKPIEMAGLSDEQVPVAARKARDLVARRVDDFWTAQERERGA